MLHDVIFGNIMVEQTFNKINGSVHVMSLTITFHFECRLNYRRGFESSTALETFVCIKGLSGREIGSNVTRSFTLIKWKF